jgi:hypothetical protein
MKKLLLIVLVAFIGQIWTAQAQDKRIEVKSKNVAKTRGENPYVKTKASTSDESPIAAPDPKDASKKECVINVANNTGFVVEVYVDGSAKGTLDAWAESTIKVRGGYKTIYAITTGKTKEWFADGDCNGKYTFVLLVGDK